MPIPLKRSLLAAACAALMGAGAASADGLDTAGGGATFDRLPAETVDRFNSPPPEQAVDSKPEIDALQDKRAEWRYQDQVDRARSREAMKERLGASDPADVEALGRDTEAAKRDTMLPGRTSSENPFAVDDAPVLTEDDVRMEGPRPLDGPQVSHDEDGRPVLQ